MNPYQIGNIAEANVLARLMTIGKLVLKPHGEGARYDLVVDNRDGTFTRGQVKNGRFREGTVVFNTASTGGFKRTPRKAYDGDAEVFWVYCRETNKVYEVPVRGASKGSMILRVSPRKRESTNSPARLAKDYEI